jgi:hypothetical protein
MELVDGKGEDAMDKSPSSNKYDLITYITY